jgi:hypothetical protein
MKIVNSFSFSEPHELPILLLKFISENDGVDEWVIVENDYTFRGHYKGYQLEKLLRSDERFDPFLHKVTIMRCSINTKAKDEPDAGKAEQMCYVAMIGQKNFPSDYIINKYNDEDWLIESDLDEILDFSDQNRKSLILDYFNKYTNALALPMIRYWFDFDNYAFVHTIETCPVRLVRQRGNISAAASINKDFAPSEPILAFEYSFCFAREHVKRKIQTNAHCGSTEEDYIEAVECNHWLMIKNRGIKVEPPTDKSVLNRWFYFVDLDETNSPKYLRDHLDEFKTNTVSPDYEENRKKYYPDWFK